jgi:hypothetical protein
MNPEKITIHGGSSNGRFMVAAASNQRPTCVASWQHHLAEAGERDGFPSDCPSAGHHAIVVLAHATQYSIIAEHQHDRVTITDMAVSSEDFNNIRVYTTRTSRSFNESKFESPEAFKTATSVAFLDCSSAR